MRKKADSTPLFYAKPLLFSLLMHAVMSSHYTLVPFLCIRVCVCVWRDSMWCFCWVIRMSRSYALSHVSHFVCVRESRAASCVSVFSARLHTDSLPTARVFMRPSLWLTSKVSFCFWLFCLEDNADDSSHCDTLSPFPRKLFLKHKCATDTCLIEDDQRVLEYGERDLDWSCSFCCHHLKGIVSLEFDWVRRFSHLSDSWVFFSQHPPIHSSPSPSPSSSTFLQQLFRPLQTAN